MTKYTWIYSFTSPLSADQEKVLSEKLAEFISVWKSHGADVTGKAELRYRHFLIVQSDPSDGRPSGCSIDSMKHSVEGILKQLDIPWADASQIFYRDQDSEIRKTHFQEFSALIKGGSIGPDHIVFDHSLSHTDDLEKWERPLHETWMARFLPTSHPAK